MQLKPSDIVLKSEKNRVFYEGSYMFLCKNKNPAGNTSHNSNGNQILIKGHHRLAIALKHFPKRLIKIKYI